MTHPTKEHIPLEWKATSSDQLLANKVINTKVWLTMATPLTNAEPIRGIMPRTDESVER
jgi:hypothetical protein